MVVWVPLAVLVPALAFAAGSGQDTVRQNLRETQRLRGEQLSLGRDATVRAGRAAAAASRLAQQQVAAAAKLQQADAATQDVAARIDALAALRRDAEQRLNARAAAMQPLLPLIERLSLYPLETLLAVPGSPDATLRGVMVLQGLSRQMEMEAEALRRDQADLDAASAALATEQPRLAAARAIQSQASALLDQQIAAAHAEQAQAEAAAGQAAGQAAAAAARMETLRAAIGALESEQRVQAARDLEAAARARIADEQAQRQKRPEDVAALRQRDAEREAGLARSVTTASMAGGAVPGGQLRPPVIGVVVKGWGEATDSGPATGVSYHAPPGARVVSPCGGRVVFDDNFRSYGLLLIIDCGGGYHVVLAGFDRLDVKLGQSIVAGEPVGVMASWEPGSTARRPALYVELRRDGQPINPAPWLRSSS